ncbi:glycerate kinase [bacterium]|nr:glycerate kinase [bacterium]
MKILIAPDSFKGSATAAEVAHAIAMGIKESGQNIDVEELPIGDGGEGTAVAIATALGGFVQQTNWVQNALGTNVRADWFYNKSQKMAVFDMASASGLAQIAPLHRSVLDANTFGTGQLVNEAMHCGVQKILICLGGSATTDAGIGMAAALGYRFIDSEGNELETIPRNLLKIAKVETPEIAGWPEITGIYDVEIPLLGPKGTVAKYAEQKGATEAEKAFLEKGLSQFAELAPPQMSHLHLQKGTGAAGGLGYGLQRFFYANLLSGFGFVSKTLKIEEKIAIADFVITGEGKVDDQTPDGKLVHGIAKLAAAHKKPLVIVAGQINKTPELQSELKAFEWISLTEMAGSAQRAMRQSKALLQQVGSQLALKYFNP